MTKLRSVSIAWLVAILASAVLLPLLTQACAPTANQAEPQVTPTEIPSTLPPPQPAATTTPTPEPIVSPLPTPTATLQPPVATSTPPPMPNDLTIRLGQDLDLVPGQSALLESLSIRATLAEAHGPRAGCFDCPNNATLQVFQGPESQALQYSFSGGMLGELLQQAKRKNAFGYTFVAVRIIEGGLTLRVEPATS